MTGQSAGKESAADRIRIIDEHDHSNQHVYPTLADGVTLTTHATDWVLGALVEIVPANAITENFDIHEIFIEAVDTKDKTYELVLYSGAGDVEIGRLRFNSGTTKGGIPNGVMMTPIIAANSRIRAALAIEDGGTKTAIISVRYHKY